MSKYVLLPLTTREADALDNAIQDALGNIANGFDVPAAEVAALRRAYKKLSRVRHIAARETQQDRDAAAVQAGLDENVALGYLELAEPGKGGEPRYRMTEAGIRHVQEMGGHSNG